MTNPIRARRLGKGLTLEQAAMASGLSAWTWRQLEAGAPSRGPRDWTPFARVLEVDPEELQREYLAWRRSWLATGASRRRRRQ